MNEAQTLFAALRQSADPDVVCAIEALVRDAPDNRLNRINALAFAAKTGLNEDRVIAAFLHAARLGLFEMSWNVLCPGCGGVLDAGASATRSWRPSRRPIGRLQLRCGCARRCAVLASRTGASTCCSRSA